MKLDFMRQEGLVDPLTLERLTVSVVGTGAVGSFTALALAKMGVGTFHLYDDDGVSAHNIPNQFYRQDDVGKFKVDALAQILHDFAGDPSILVHREQYSRHILHNGVFVCPDSMASRRDVWNAFKTQPTCDFYIEARMGSEIGIVYAIRRKEGRLSAQDVRFYEKTLFSDAEAEEVPCTEKAIIYNVLMISSIMCRALKAIVRNELFNRETIFSMVNMHYQVCP